jgi:hypothetical protein
MDTDNKTKRRGAEDAEQRRVKNLCDTLRSLRFAPSSVSSVVKTIPRETNLCDTQTAMNEPGEDLPKPTYKWPWFVLAAVLLFVVLAVVFMSFKAEQIKQQRDFSAPLPASAPAR